MKSNREFIVYGKTIDSKKFIKPHNGRNQFLNKPDGGLWSSPTNSRWCWKDWCSSENYPIRLDVWTRFRLAPEARVLEIDCLDHLRFAFKEYGKRLPPYGDVVLDWNLLRAHYDAIFLSEQGNSECHLPLELNSPDFNGWDCECLLVLDLNKIIVTRESDLKEVVTQKEREEV
jgi:hypothetical protein